jgi:hypothetical protein
LPAPFPEDVEPELVLLLPPDDEPEELLLEEDPEGAEPVKPSATAASSLGAESPKPFQVC